MKNLRPYQVLQDPTCSGPCCLTALVSLFPQHTDLSLRNSFPSLNRPGMLSAPGFCTWCILSLQSIPLASVSLPPTLSQVLPEKVPLTTLDNTCQVHIRSFYILSASTPTILNLFITFISTRHVLWENLPLPSPYNVNSRRARALFCSLWHSQHLEQNSTCRHSLKIYSKKY